MADAKSYNQRGQELLHNEQYEEAVQYFTQAIENDSTFAEAYQNRGEVYIKLGQTKEAEADFQQANDLKSQTTATSNKNKYRMEEIDNLYDELFPESALLIDDPYEDLFPDIVPVKGIRAILEYLDGTTEDHTNIIFCPGEDQITILLEGDKGERVVSLNKLSCVQSNEIPLDINEDREVSHVEAIETINGRRYRAHIPNDQGIKQGIIGFAVEHDAPYRYSFFPHQNINHRCQERYIGEILIDKGAIDSDGFIKALEDHKQLKKMKFGQIIAQQANLIYSTVNLEIQKAYSEARGEIKVGEILINAGLVNEEQVRKALMIQKKVQNMKIGQFLLEKGMVKEQDIFVALAEKFRYPFVDLRDKTISHEALKLVPKELMHKLKVLPISYNKSVLEVATIHPDVPSLKDILSKHTKQQNIKFVVVRPTLMKAALKKIS